MKCAVCHRNLTRAAYTLGRLDFGPTCFKKLLAEGRKAKRVELSMVPAGDLLDGCYFDQRGAQDRQRILEGAHA